MTTVFANGCFDLLHVGHVHFLTWAKDQGDHLVVGVNSDASVARLKGEWHPIICGIDRVYLLMSLSCVDEAWLFDEDTPLNMIQSLNPDVLAVGPDHSLDDEQCHWVRKNGGIVSRFPHKESPSRTDEIIQRIRMIEG